MNTEWIITGIILLGGMLAAGTRLYLKRRKESQISDSSLNTETTSVFTESDE
ncbi:MAG: hypothetical protein ACT4OD_02785 [Candidatus Nitrosotenuis sp.]